MTEKITLTKDEAIAWLKEHGADSLLGMAIEDPLRSVVDIEGARQSGMLKDGEDVKVTFTVDDSKKK